jgi:hypothetical protein
MTILEVRTHKLERLFHKLPRTLYRKDPFWVCPLDSDIEQLFHPASNRYLDKGNCNRWILFDHNGVPIGRIAAFYNRDISQNELQPTGGIGFFECVNNYEAAKLLFDTARNWLIKEGLEAMDAPVNPGPNDTNWGLLIEGFSHPGYGMPYNFPYYKELFEKYGFREYYRQYSYHLQIRKPFPERVWKIADWVSKKPGFSFRHFRYQDSERYIADVVKIYNEAWASFKEDFKPLEPENLRNTLKKARTIVDEKLIWFAYHNEEPIAFFILLPDVNQLLKKINGRLNPWSILRFLYFLKTKKINRIRAMAAGVVPRFQNSGVESGIFKELEKVFLSPGYIHYKEIELSWVGEFNPKMRSIYESLGAELAKIHITMRLHFDQTIPVSRFMNEQSELVEKFHIKQFHVDRGESTDQ